MLRIRHTAFAVVLLARASVPAQQPVTVRAGFLIDGRGHTQKNVLISIRGSKIERIAPYAAGAKATWDLSKGERLRDILGSHRGDCPVTLELVRPGAFAVSLAPSSQYRVRPDAVLRDEVEALLGPGALVLSRTSTVPRAL